MAIEKAFAKNVELVGYHDLENRVGFQMAMQVVDGRYYLYVTARIDQGFTIMDVTDPAKPELVKYVPEPGGKSCTITPKIQVADGLLVLGLAKPVAWFTPRSGTEYDEGIRIWDVKDPENPKHLALWETGGLGTHRNYYGGGRYVHLSAKCPGFIRNIYRILDIEDPTKPVEVGRWWLPEQWEAGGAQNPMNVGLHGGPYPKGDYVYLSYSSAGMIVLDISDITLPKFVGQMKIYPPFGGGSGEPPCHTVMPFSQRPLAIVTSEGSRIATAADKEALQGRVMPMNLFGIADISDPAQPTLISTFPYPEVPPGYPHRNFSEIEGIGVYGFGVHNIHEPHYNPDLEDRDDRIYAAYYSAGLRVYDVSDPFVPKEIAYYIPPEPKKWLYQPALRPYPGPLAVTVEDIIVDNRGYIYIDNQHDGLYILRCTV